jgi:F0F1-type ATP synthase membrane subunit b/b'
LRTELELARKQARMAADELRRNARAQAETERIAARKKFEASFFVISCFLLSL